MGPTHSGLQAGEGNSAARRPRPSNSPQSFLDEISLAKHLMALAGSQHGCSWVIAPVPKSRGSALGNVGSLEDVPIFSDSKDMVLHPVTRALYRSFWGSRFVQEILRESWAQKPGPATWSNMEMLGRCHMQRFQSEAEFGQQQWRISLVRGISR